MRQSREGPICVQTNLIIPNNEVVNFTRAGIRSMRAVAAEEVGGYYQEGG